MKKSQLRQIIREVIREAWYEKDKDGSVKSNLDKGGIRGGMSAAARAADTDQSDAEYIKQRQQKSKDVTENAEKNKDRQAKGWEMDRQKKMENALHALNDKIQPAIDKNDWVNEDVPEKEFLAKTGLSLSQLASYRHIYDRAWPISSHGMDFDLISYDPSHRMVYVKDPMDV